MQNVPPGTPKTSLTGPFSPAGPSDYPVGIDPVRGSCCDSEKRLRAVSSPGVRFLSQARDFGSGMQRAQVGSGGGVGVRTPKLGVER